MLLKPITLMHLGDAYRFFVDAEQLPNIVVHEIHKFEMGYTHSEPVAWEDVAMSLKETFLDFIDRHGKALEIQEPVLEP